MFQKKLIVNLFEYFFKPVLIPHFFRGNLYILDYFKLQFLFLIINLDGFHLPDKFISLHVAWILLNNTLT